MKKRFATAFCLCMLGYLLWPREDENVREINEGTLMYTEELGWVDLKHARTEGVRRFVNKLESGGAEITYFQNMKTGFGQRNWVAEYRETYKLLPELTSTEREQAAWQIFKSVSEGFEEMQADFPYSLSCGSNQSSFGLGDLTGNLVSFYLVIHDKKWSDLKLSALPKDQTLFLYNNLKEKRMEGWRYREAKDKSELACYFCRLEDNTCKKMELLKAESVFGEQSTISESLLTW